MVIPLEESIRPRVFFSVAESTGRVLVTVVVSDLSWTLSLFEPEDVYRLAAALLRAADQMHGGARSGSVER